LHGAEYYPQPSRFLGELPGGILSEIRMGRDGGQSIISSLDAVRNNDTGLSLGQRVVHAKFGEGIVLSLEGKGSTARVQVNFEQAGSKWLVLAYADLQTEV
jgi:DNA helicase-2/ATP-dependent DNA helicase PcrA